MDQTKHRNIKYVEGENKACFEINKPQFRQTTCLDETDQYYEIELAKKNIKLDLPIQLGFFILQYAKLRMLEFYYDFLDSYVDRSDFEYIEMDTVSFKCILFTYVKYINHILVNNFKLDVVFS